MKILCGFLVSIFSCIAVAQQPAAVQRELDPAIQSLLLKMAQAPDQINYRGVFTYQNQSVVEPNSISVEHWVDKGIGYDRLVFLNGPEREVVRSGQPANCNSMGDKLIAGSFVSVGNALSKLTDVYHFEVRKGQRVAGRNTQVLQVIPLDPYRYRYFLSLDEQTGLILKSWLINEDAMLLERYQFISIDFNPSVADMQKTKNLTHQHKAASVVTPCHPEALESPKGWTVNWVPTGFVFAGEKLLKDSQSVLMYTDGLSAFSIFLEPTKKFIPLGVGYRGATLAYLSSLDVKNVHYRVSVVGEIPVVAAAKIAQSIAANQQN